MANIIAVVAEDRLTEAVLHKCVGGVLPDFRIHRTEVKGGRGNVQRELRAYAALAGLMPVLVGVDLDDDECAPTLLANWGMPSQRGLLVRVAVREIEAWVLADQKRVASLIGAAANEVPKRPDQLADPKRSLLELARTHAKSDVKADLVPRNYDAQYPRIGPAYNLRMCAFVKDRWRPHVAREKSKSLNRALLALEQLR